MGEEKLSKVELIKREGNYLRGTIARALQDGTAKFEEENIQQLKFHGVYQQDDRDLRKQLRQAGKDRHYMMMIRARIPGGILSASQYLQFDAISERWGNGTMRITTRQTFQLHGVLKGDLKATIKAINDSLITTLGGCGDQVRNIIACPKPRREGYAKVVREDLLALVNRFAAQTKAYHEIWLDGERVNLADGPSDPSESGSKVEEPLYGSAYLPRKFKIGFAYEGDNCVDVYANDLGIVAHVENDQIAGYTLLIGGGMGRTASDVNTYPRLATPFAFATRAQLVETAEAIINVQRDYGNRENRKFARMKYLLDAMGMEWFQNQVEERLGYALNPPRDLVWESFADHLSWHPHHHGVPESEGPDGFLGLFIENGRIQDNEDRKLKTVLREVIREYQPTVHLTSQQNLLLDGLKQADLPVILERLRKAGVPLAEDLSLIRQNAMACPSMPTCGLAIAESERALPTVLPQLETLVAKYGLSQEPVTVRMSGCPNGCSRPYVSDIGLVGRVIGKYDLFLGADSLGTRINKLFREQVPLEEIIATLEPVIALYARERRAGERLGNFCHRIGFSVLREVVSVNR